MHGFSATHYLEQKIHKSRMPNDISQGEENRLQRWKREVGGMWQQNSKVRNINTWGYVRGILLYCMHKTWLKAFVPLVSRKIQFFTICLPPNVFLLFLSNSFLFRVQNHYIVMSVHERQLYAVLSVGVSHCSWLIFFFKMKWSTLLPRKPQLVLKKKQIHLTIYCIAPKQRLFMLVTQRKLVEH